MKKDSTVSKRYCPSCNTLLLENVSLCPVCGKEVKRLDAAVTRGFSLFFRLLLIVVVVFTVAVVVIGVTNKELITGFINRFTAFIS